MNLDDDRRPAPELKVEVTGTEAAVLILPAGELDLATAEQLEQAVVRELANSPAALVIDLSGVTFMDSVALGALLRCEEWAREEGIRFAINPGKHQPRRLLELCGLMERLQTAGLSDPAD